MARRIRDGLGQAIGQRALLAQELQSGQLIRSFSTPLQCDQGHYLVRPAVQRESRKVAAYRDWILRAAAEV
jgi:LysR family glycine cleavage system transcriptional activator